MDENTKWYYAEKGKQIGPVTSDAIKALVVDGKINQDTSVWNGKGDWKPARTTELSSLFERPSDVPPPLMGADVDNKYVWLVVAVPLIGLVIELMAGKELTMVYVALNIALCLFDGRKLKAAGHMAPGNIWAFLVPVYLWKRAGMLKQSKLCFWAWIVTFSLSIFLANLERQSSIEDTACTLVTQILHEQLGANSATCKAVKIGDEISAGFYKATATLDNGNDLAITIEEKKDNQIFVQIPNQ